MENVKPARLWSLIPQLEHEVVREFLREHALVGEVQDVLAEHLRCIETVVTRKPQGLISVTVSLIAHRVTKNQVRAFSLQTAGGRLYKVVR